MNKIAWCISLSLDDWTAELVIIASSAMLCFHVCSNLDVPTVQEYLYGVRLNTNILGVT